MTAEAHRKMSETASSACRRDGKGSPGARSRRSSSAVRSLKNSTLMRCAYCETPWRAVSSRGNLYATRSDDMAAVQGYQDQSVIRGMHSATARQRQPPRTPSMRAQPLLREQSRQHSHSTAGDARLDHYGCCGCGLAPSATCGTCKTAQSSCQDRGSPAAACMSAPDAVACFRTRNNASNSASSVLDCISRRDSSSGTAVTGMPTFRRSGLREAHFEQTVEFQLQDETPVACKGMQFAGQCLPHERYTHPRQAQFLWQQHRLANCQSAAAQDPPAMASASPSLPAAALRLPLLRRNRPPPTPRSFSLRSAMMASSSRSTYSTSSTLPASRGPTAQPVRRLMWCVRYRDDNSCIVDQDAMAPAEPRS